MPELETTLVTGQRTLLLIILHALTTLIAVSALATPSALDRSLAPYFFVEDGDPTLDALPLESTRVDAAIAGNIADVTVHQTYKNNGKRPINARYVFPASTRAAVYGLRMTIGNKTIVAKIH